MKRSPDSHTILCPHCRRPIERGAARRRCPFCGEHLRKKIGRASDPLGLLTFFGYKMAGLGLGAWGGALLWTIHKTDTLHSDHVSHPELGAYLVVGAGVGFLLTTLACHIIRPQQRRMFECVLGALWIGVFSTLLTVLLYSVEGQMALSLLLVITWISYLLLARARLHKRHRRPVQEHLQQISREVPMLLGTMRLGTLSRVRGGTKSPRSSGDRPICEAKPRAQA